MWKQSQTGLCWLKRSSRRKVCLHQLLLVSVWWLETSALSASCGALCRNARTGRDEEFGLRLSLARFIWKGVKLPVPGTHFHRDESKSNQDWLLFSSEIEGGLCGGFDFKQPVSLRVDDDISWSCRYFCVVLLIQFPPVWGDPAAAVHRLKARLQLIVSGPAHPKRTVVSATQLPAEPHLSDSSPGNRGMPAGGQHGGARHVGLKWCCRSLMRAESTANQQ